MGNDRYDKTCIEKMIIEYGGEIVQNPGENTYCIVTSKLIHKINSYIKKDLYDIVKLDWIVKCIGILKLTLNLLKLIYYVLNK
jgi:DNA ligase-4